MRIFDTYFHRFEVARDYFLELGVGVKSHLDSNNTGYLADCLYFWGKAKVKGTFKKDSTEFQMFTDFWNMVKEYYIPEDDPKYWISLFRDANKFGKKYKVTSTTELQRTREQILAQKLVMAFTEYAEDAKNLK